MIRATRPASTTRMARMSSGFKATLLACAAWMALAACAAPAAAPTASNTSAAPSTAAGKGIQLKDGEKLTVGFIFVGTADDYGYNYAADQGRLALEKNLPYVKTLAAYSVPENAEAERVMEDMIRQGAKIIFPTSYGHLDPAMNVAKRHPEVTFLHQGGLKNTTNVGTYFGEIWQDVYAAGIVAGKESKTGKLGFVAAFPIPQVLLNINAFELGAKSVNPDVKTTVVFTADWCNPGKLTDAANTLMDGGADVLTAHEDCPAAVIQAAERRGMMSVGYHADGSPLAPKGWLTGARWTWDGLYTDLVKQVVAGTYVSQIYRAGVKDNVVGLSPFGAAVTPDVRTLATNAEKGIIDGSVFPFQGPVTDQSGKIRIEAGKRPNTTELESTDYLVDGVIGTIPS